MSSTLALVEKQERKRSDATLCTVCIEPEGAVERCVYSMPLSVENLRVVWEKSKEHPTLFSQEIRQDFGKFISLFVKEGKSGLEATGLFWVVDDFVGVFYLTEILEHDALVHYSFFDGRFRGREQLTKDMIKFAFLKYGFTRLTALVPVYAPAALVYARHVGFAEEGRKRRAVWYRPAEHPNADGWIDVIMFGILREEVLDGR